MLIFIPLFLLLFSFSSNFDFIFLSFFFALSSRFKLNFKLHLCFSDHVVQRWPTSDKCSRGGYAEAWPGSGDWTGSTVWRWDLQMCSGQRGWSCWDIPQSAGVRWVAFLLFRTLEKRFVHFWGKYTSQLEAPAPFRIPLHWTVDMHHFSFFLLSSLYLSVPPVISSRGGTVTVVVNEAARLACEATGVPLPSLTWLKDGSPVASISPGMQVLVREQKKQTNYSFFCMVVFVYICACSVFLSGVVWGQIAGSEQCTSEWYRQVHLCGCQCWRGTTQRLWREGLW